MTTDGVLAARTFLDLLEAGIAARDLPALEALCAPDVVLFGAARANFGAEATRDYLRMVVEANSVRWVLDEWAILHHDDATLLAAAEGHVLAHDGETVERSAFRLTLWLIRDGEGWKLGHFHGSMPAA